MTEPLLRIPYAVRQRLGALGDKPDALAALNASLVALTGRVDLLDPAVAQLKAAANAQALTIALQQQALESLQATSPVFLTGTYTVGAGASQLPAAAGNVGKYARVTDLWGDNTRDVLLAASSVVAGVVTSYWMPLRPVHAQTQAAGTMTLKPLVNAQVQFLTGAVAAGMAAQVNLSTVGAWPGAMWEIAFDGTLGLGATLNIAGTGLGSLLGLAAGARRRLVFDQGGWKQFS